MLTKVTIYMIHKSNFTSFSTNYEKQAGTPNNLDYSLTYSSPVGDHVTQIGFFDDHVMQTAPSACHVTLIDLVVSHISSGDYVTLTPVFFLDSYEKNIVDIFMCATNLCEIVKTGLLINLCSSVLCIVMYGMINI